LVLIIIYNISSTKLEIRAEQFLPGSEGVRGRGQRLSGRNGPNTVCIYE
jgi:hypothetical protein